jgi:CheY-like chemotaxis protein
MPIAAASRRGGIPDRSLCSRRSGPLSLPVVGSGTGPGGPVLGSLGRYQLLERIGAGGFGAVYRAWDEETRRPVAIKACTLGEEMHARFLREAELAGGLRHPNITEVYGSGIEGDTPFIVQELLAGEDLSALIARREPASLGSKLEIIRGVAEALDFAHRSGVIHRDVKPANVRVLPDGTVKLMDFGIAKALGSVSSITKSGIGVGSIGYMSPEQVSGDPVDERSDLFCLGVLAYELMSFRPPFRNDNLFGLLEMIVKDDPDPLTEIADVPPEVAAVVACAMEKEPARRYRSAAEMRDALPRLEQRQSDRAEAKSGAPIAAAKARGAPVSAAARNGAAILVVEDDYAVREGLRGLLEEEGYRAVGAADGREALALASPPHETPGLILLDLKMPVMDGWQFLAEWRNRKPSAHCPVVLLSGLGFIQDAPGVADFLSKPVDAGRLLACVRRLYGPANASRR